MPLVFLFLVSSSLFRTPIDSHCHGSVIFSSSPFLAPIHFTYGTATILY